VHAGEKREEDWEKRKKREERRPAAAKRKMETRAKSVGKGKESRSAKGGSRKK